MKAGKLREEMNQTIKEHQTGEKILSIGVLFTIQCIFNRIKDFKDDEEVFFSFSQEI